MHQPRPRAALYATLYASSGDGDESSADVPARFDMVDLLGELFEPSGLVELRRRSAGLTHMLPRRLSDRPRSSLEAVEADVVVVVVKLARRFRSLTASTDEPRLDCCWLDCWLRTIVCCRGAPSRRGR